MGRHNGRRSQHQAPRGPWPLPLLKSTPDRPGHHTCVPGQGCRPVGGRAPGSASRWAPFWGPGGRALGRAGGGNKHLSIASALLSGTCVRECSPLPSMPVLQRDRDLARRPDFAELAREHLPVKDYKRIRHRRPLPDLLKNLRRNSGMCSPICSDGANRDIEPLCLLS